MQAFAALQHAYSILQRHDHDSLPAPMSQPEAEQAASSQHNRLLLQAYEIPHSCWHLLPPHLQAGADAVPCNTPFLAFPLDGLRSQAQRGPSATASGGPSATASEAGGKASAAVTAAGVRACVEESVLPLLPKTASQGCAKGMSSPPDAAAAGASNASACLNTSHEQHEAVIAGIGASLVSDLTLQHATTCCSARTACTACRSVATRIGSDGPTVLAASLPDNSAAGSACTAAPTLTADKTCKAGAADISPVDVTDILSDQSTVSANSSRQGQGQGPGQGQGLGPEQGQGPGQGQGLVQMALLVPCRKAMKDRFPLNGTFFQVNEVFLDHSSIMQPLQVFPAVSHKTAKS